jgi:hypothetical protein
VQLVVQRVLLAYLAIGLLLSTTQNLWGILTSGLTAFAWTGSLAGNAILLFWWFLVPILAWPLDVYWSIYHAVVR